LTVQAAGTKEEPGKSRSFCRAFFEEIHEKFMEISIIHRNTIKRFKNLCTFTKIYL
jgi:hypothetical protein